MRYGYHDMRDTSNSTVKLPNHRNDLARDGFQVCINLFEWTRRSEYVKLAVEGNLVADLRLLMVDPRVGKVGQNLAVEVGVNLLIEWHVLSVPQSRIRQGLAFVLAFR